jgi:uncharacterized OsmC-like protein
MTTTQETINGVNLTVVQKLVDDISANPQNGQVGFAVTTAWKGGTKSQSRIDGWTLGGRKIAKQMKIEADEPVELAGQNTGPNPQELLMAAFNSCMIVGYVAGASLKGIELESVEIETTGQLDLRGFLGLDSSVKPGYDKLHYTVRIKGAGTTEQFREIHQTVMATSPNRWNIANPIKLTSDLIVD